MAFTVIKSQDVCTDLLSMYTFNNTFTNQYNADPFNGPNTFAGGMYLLTANNVTRTATVAALPVGNSHRTIAMRVQPTGNSSGTPTIFKYGSNANSQMFGAYYSVSTGTLTFQGFGNDFNVPNFNVAQGTWFNLVLTYDGSDLRIYVNGVLKLQTAVALNTGTAIPFTLGGNGTIYHDNLRIYHRALSAADVAQLDTDMDFDCSVTPDICTGLVTSYSFDQTLANESGTEAFSGTGGVASDAVAGESLGTTTSSANISNLPTGNSARTISCWFNRGSGSGDAIIFSYGTANNGEKFGAYVNLANGNLTFQGFGFGYDELINNTQVPSYTWHHIAVAYTGTMVKVYYDGILREQFARNLTTGSGQPFTLGNGSNISYDDLKIFDRALSSDDVFELYNKPQYVCNIASSGACQDIRTTYSFNNTTSSQNNSEDFVPTTGGAPTFSPGIADSAMNCVSYTSYTTSISTLPLGNSARTVSLWIQPTSIAGINPNIFNYGGNGNGNKFGLYLASGGALHFRGNGTFDEPINNASLPFAIWYHLALVYTGNYVQVYLDGVLKESFQRDLNTTANNMLFTLGGFGGLVDDLRIYNRALSEDDVAAIYAAPETTCTIIPPLMPTASVNSIVCEGATINFTASITGTATPTYSWSGPNGFTSNIQNPSITNANSAHVGTYILTVDNGGNIETAATQVLNVMPPPAIGAYSSQPNILCFGQTATLTAYGADTYTWNPGGNGSSIVVSPTVTTTYSLTGVSEYGCEANTVLTQSVSVCTGINNLSANENLMLQIYPNPANDVITINYDGLKETNSSIEIINTVGQTLIKQDVANETSQNISVSNLTSGIYFVQIKQNGKSIATKKLVINK